MEHPIEAALIDIGEPPSGIAFPPQNWRVVQSFGNGWALMHSNGLRAIVDCSLKSDENFWVHVSVSRASRAPSHLEMATVKRDFLGNRYAYSVWPPSEKYVNIHEYCLHLWSRVDKQMGMVLPEFSSVVEGIGLTI